METVLRIRLQWIHTGITKTRKALTNCSLSKLEKHYAENTRKKGSLQAPDFPTAL